MRRLLREWRDARRFAALAPEQRAIVFYAEDAASRVHFDEILGELTGRLGREVCYLTSSHADPVLGASDPRIRAFCIGSGTVRTSLFLRMQAGVVAMTLPELERYQVKRSRLHPVHYAYVFHSLASTHMIYREGAFDHYDSVLCAGPHHAAEIRARETREGLPAKRLVEAGYGRLDALLRNRESAGPRAPDGSPRVLVAPSWGASGLLETRGAELCEALLAAGCRVTVRPHPMTRRKWPGAVRELERRFAGREGFALESDVGSQASLHAADLMVSDWSGAALEFAFALERPVLFVDVPRKVQNSAWEALGCEPLEISIRGEIGAVLSPERLAEIPQALERLRRDAVQLAGRIRAARERCVFHVGESGRAGAEYLARVADGGTR